MEIFLPDLENHELMFSLSRRFEDGPLTPTLVMDAYRYCYRLAREYGKPAEIWLFSRYPAYSFYQFDQQRGDRALLQHRSQERHSRLRGEHGRIVGQVPGQRYRGSQTGMPAAHS